MSRGRDRPAPPPAPPFTALATPELEADVREFFTSRNITLGGGTLEQYLEQLHVAVVFREREGARFETYLARRFLR